MKKGNIVDLNIEKLSYGGLGLAHYEDMVIFVKGGIPGQLVKSKIYKKKKKYLEAYVLEILKESNDGLYISEEVMKLRGFGDLLGYKQSGIKDFKLADPIKHKDLFEIAEKNIKNIEDNENSFKKYEFLLRLFDKADILNYIS